jgi:hypothetical protein
LNEAAVALNARAVAHTPASQVSRFIQAGAVLTKHSPDTDNFIESDYGQIMPRYSTEVNDCYHDDGNCDDPTDGGEGGGGTGGGGTAIYSSLLMSTAIPS